MKKIVPFKQEVFFKTQIDEITSISLEHTLKKEEDYLVSGNFILTGDYKMTDVSINTEAFDFTLPFDIVLDDKYDTSKITVDIEDFYYEIVNENKMLVNIEVCIDNLEEKPLIEDLKEEIIDDRETLEHPIVIDEEVAAVFEEVDKTTNDHTTYHIYIMRENDTLESVLIKYKLTKEELSIYNDVENIKIGDKLIIPYIDEN